MKLALDLPNPETRILISTLLNPIVNLQPVLEMSFFQILIFGVHELASIFVTPHQSVHCLINYLLTIRRENSQKLFIVESMHTVSVLAINIIDFLGNISRDKSGFFVHSINFFQIGNSI